CAQVERYLSAAERSPTAEAAVFESFRVAKKRRRGLSRWPLNTGSGQKFRYFCMFEEWVGRAEFWKPGDAERGPPRLARCYGQSLSSVIRGKSALTALKSGSSAVTPRKLNFSASA